MDKITAPLPPKGEEEWYLERTEFDEQVRESLDELADLLKTGRLSPEGLTAAIQAAAESISPAELSDSFVADKISSPTSEAGVAARSVLVPQRVDYVTAQQFNYVDDGTDQSAKLQEMFDYAHEHKVPIRLRGDIRGSVSLVDKSVVVNTESGRWIQSPGTTPLRIEHTLLGGLTGQAVTNIGSLWLVGSGESDEGTKYLLYNTLTVNDATFTELNPNQGDWLKVGCDNAYAGDFLGTGRSTWISEPAQVAGVLLRATLIGGGGGINPDQIVTGQTSGATGYVAASRQEFGEPDTLKRALMLNAVTGVFTDGESLVQGGTVRGTLNSKAIAVMPMLNFGLITSNPVIHKYRSDLPVDVSGVVFGASGDVDSDQPAASRAPAIEMMTVAGASLDMHVKTSWRQGIRAISCVAFKAELRIDKLPGYAEDAKSAWGYGFEAMGGCGYGSVKLFVNDVRHGFSTNIRVNTIAPSASADAAGAYFTYARAGVAMKIDVEGEFFNCTDAALDTHGGSMGIRFHNFYVSGSASGGRTQARSTGVQNRSWATVIENGTIEDVADGIRDISHYFPSPFPAAKAITYIRNVTMRGILTYGIVGLQPASTDESKGYARVVISDVDITMRSVSNVGALAPNVQCGVRYRGGRIEMENVKVRGYNGFYAKFTAGADGVKEVIIRGGLMDIAESPNQPYGVFLEGGDFPVLTVLDLKARVGTWSVPSIIRSNTAMPNTVLRTDGCGPIDADGTNKTGMAIISGTNGTMGTTQRPVNGNVTLEASAAWDPPSLAPGARTTLNVTVTGARFGDFVRPSFSAALQGLELSAHLFSSSVVQVVLFNPSTATGTVDLAAGTVKVRVEK